MSAITRRELIAGSAGLVVGFALGGCARAPGGATPPGPNRSFEPNAFVRVAPDGAVTLICGKSEMGQGVWTALAMLLAEELDADFARVAVEAAPADAAYNHPLLGVQVTAMSSSVATSYEQIRLAGATARAMLVAAAAERWGVAAATLRTEAHAVVNARAERLAYGELADSASRLAVPAGVAPKDPKDFRLVGQPTRRVEGRDKTRGRATFGLDVRRPNQRYALVARPPLFGAALKSVDEKKARAVPGVVKVKRVPGGVAVIATNSWAARKGRDALAIEWDLAGIPRLETAPQGEAYARLAQTPGALAAARGDAEAELRGAARRVEALYEVPYLAHAPMEPLNCTVEIRDGAADVWTGTQLQTIDRIAAARVLGLPLEKVRLHTTLLGGGFGRRASPHADFVAEACAVAKDEDAPVQTLWSREDDIRGGYYRPRATHAIAAALGADGGLAAWRSRVVAQSIYAGTPFEAIVRDGVDPSIVEGVAQLPYAVADFRVEAHLAPPDAPVLWWRSVGHSHNAFAVECFVDELAKAAGADPVVFRRALLASAPRERAALDLVAERARWSEPAPAGRARGVALHACFGSVVAMVAEASVDDEGHPRVERVVCAVDCGRVINPAHVAAQVESGIAFGLSAALYGAITFARGEVQQLNFGDYAILRGSRMPIVDVHLVPSDAAPSGVGEIAVPPIAPAVCNALYALTGRRIRKLPIRAADLRPTGAVKA